jgi:hypothetical protein
VTGVCPNRLCPIFPLFIFHVFFQESEAGGGAGGELTMEEEKNDEKMALQSIYDSAFTEKIPGRGSVMPRRWLCSQSMIPPLQKYFRGNVMTVDETWPLV